MLYDLVRALCPLADDRRVRPHHTGPCVRGGQLDIELLPGDDLERRQRVGRPESAGNLHVDSLSGGRRTGTALQAHPHPARAGFDVECCLEHRGPSERGDPLVPERLLASEPDLTSLRRRIDAVEDAGSVATGQEVPVGERVVGARGWLRDARPVEDADCRLVG